MTMITTMEQEEKIFFRPAEISTTFGRIDTQRDGLTHQVGREGLLLVDGNLRDLAPLVDVAALDGLELEITGHARVDQQLDQQPVGHQELGYEVDVPVPAAAILALGQLDAKPREQILEGRNRGGLAAVVLIAVDMEHLLARHGQHSAEDALLQPSAEDNGVVLLIHGSAAATFSLREKKQNLATLSGGADHTALLDP